jgi:hypothetical protein
MWKYFVLLYEDRIMKPINIVLQRGEEDMREKDRGGESSQDVL